MYKGGKKIFWSRGNGWSFAAIPRILDYLPETDSNRVRYIQFAREMAASLKTKQSKDGYWRINLINPDEYPGPETSGTAFFCYGSATGINRGYLDREIYLDTVCKAWKALVEAVHLNGKLGYVQVPTATAGSVTFEDTQAYGAGAFLLAGEEMVKLMETNIQK